MPGDHLKKVKTRDPLRIPAQTFNTFIDAAQDFQRRQSDISRNAQASVRRNTIIPIKNGTGQDLDRFSVPPLAVRMMKEFVIRFRDIPITEAWRVQTLMNALLTQLSTDGDEGRQAFLEKRPPEFTGGIRQKGAAYPDLSEEEWARLDELRREIL